MKVNRDSLHDGTCACGKLKFRSVSLANKYNGANKQRIYFCNISSTYHATNRGDNWDSSKPQPPVARFNIRRLQKELNDMATMQEIILNYMRGKYKRTEEYKCSSKELTEHVLKERPGTKPAYVHQELSKMKNAKVLTGLDEKVPDQRGAKYFCLTEHLDEVTKPKSNEVKQPEVTKVGETVGTVEVKKTEVAKPTVVAHNPFDKVNSQLGEILSKVNGIATGYAQMVERISSSDSAEIINLLVEIKDLASSHVTVDGDKLADVINSRLQDYQREDSFIYGIRGEVVNETGKSVEGIYHALDKLKAPEKFDNLTDDEKYRQGIKDGIKLAVEMGLILPDA